MKRNTDNAEVYNYYLNGRFNYHKFTGEGYLTAIKYYDKALEIEPDHATALSALGGVAQEYEWDWEKAGGYYRKSLEIEPNNATFHQWYAEHLAQQGRFDEALAEIEVAKQLDPLALILRVVAGWIYMTANRPQESIAELEAIIEMDPAWPGTYLYIDLPYLMVGREKEAVDAMVHYVRLTDRAAVADSVAQAYATGGMAAYWNAVIDELKRTDRSPGLIGFYFAYAGQPDSAMTYLERAAEERAFPIHVVAVTQWLRSMHGDPRLQALIERMKLEHVKPAY